MAVDVGHAVSTQALHQVVPKLCSHHGHFLPPGKPLDSGQKK